MYKKVLAVFSALTVFLTSLTACDNKNDNSSGKPLVYASFYAVYDFTKKVAGDKIQVENMIPAGVDAHHWEPSPSDIRDLENADLLITNGVEFEGWVDSVTESLANKELKIIDTSEGIDLLENTSYADADEESHDEEEEHHDEEDNHDEEEHEHSHGEYDPHIWTSLKNAVKQMENIKNALCELDPDNKDYYEANYNEQKSKFLALDEEYSEAAKNFSQKTLVVSHKAFSYLCRDYGLEQIALRGISAENEPDAGTLKTIVDTLKEENVKSVFYEEFINQKVSQEIAKEVNADLYELSPAETLSQEQIDNGEDYLSVMKKNLETLKEALK